MIRPFLKDLHEGDEVLVKKYGISGIIEKVLPNPYLQLPWLYPNYWVKCLVNNATEGSGIFKRNDLKLIKRKVWKS